MNVSYDVQNESPEELFQRNSLMMFIYSSIQWCFIKQLGAIESTIYYLFYQSELQLLFSLLKIRACSCLAEICEFFKIAHQNILPQVPQKLRIIISKFEFVCEIGRWHVTWWGIDINENDWLGSTKNIIVDFP